MSEDLTSSRNPDDLAHLPPARLRQLWSQAGMRGEPPAAKPVLVRELAWHMQTKFHGGLDADTRRLLKAAVREAASAAEAAQAEHTADPVRRRRKARPKPTLATGTRLVRTWRGRQHEVLVLDDGRRFEYRGTQYRSLTEIAEAITGAHWSGPRFFGLDRVRSVA